MLPLGVPYPRSLIKGRVFVPPDSGLQPEGRHPTRGVAASAFRPLRNIPTAASRRSLGRISVPMWLIILSDQLPVVALVSRYLTNKLIGREPLSWCDLAATFTLKSCGSSEIRGIIRPLGRLSPAKR